MIIRKGTQPASRGPAEQFTGDVRVQPLFGAEETAPYSGAYVTFQPGARSAWHTHPAGQRLVVTDGAGRTQEEGGPVEELRPGDVVWCPPGVRHWHGAAPESAMTHLALSGIRDGRAVDWLEHVTDEEYGASGG
ncbi:cupin domain-containing protein [Dactylosporangium sucinum]|uniref:Cupin n=1 Tax=Dactylosporangium sucinum TaxID=1424081 RepID=A0A917U0S5_9ACTN|nr:cupin domain-containing protein [Dactylosporangium sucinum]GGM47406.1 cupin [Dactylosporangium sucinum]